MDDDPGLHPWQHLEKQERDIGTVECVMRPVDEEHIARPKFTGDVDTAIEYRTSDHHVGGLVNRSARFGVDADDMKIKLSVTCGLAKDQRAVAAADFDQAPGAVMLHQRVGGERVASSEMAVFRERP